MNKTIFHNDSDYQYQEDLLCRACRANKIYVRYGDMYLNYYCNNPECKSDYIEVYNKKERSEYHFFVGGQEDVKVEICISISGKDQFKKHFPAVFDSLDFLEVYRWQSEDIERLFDVKVIGDGDKGKLRVSRIQGGINGKDID